MAFSNAPGAGSVEPADHPPIAFDEADWQWFVERCAALQVPCPERTPCEVIYGHLVGVNAWLNLTRLTDTRAWLKQHLLDSLILHRLDWAAEHQRGAPLLDLGSGGGYPGLPLALTMPQRRVVLMDSRSRKVRFLAAAGGLIGERVQAQAFRGREAERAAPELAGRCGLVVSRATGSPADLVPEIQPLLAPGGRAVIWQGPSHDDAARKAVADLPKRNRLRIIEEHVVVLEDGDPERRLVVLG
jgi:16S rRNA (guanine527-N7)-methyltransferase